MSVQLLLCISSVMQLQASGGRMMSFDSSIIFVVSRVKGMTDFIVTINIIFNHFRLFNIFIIWLSLIAHLLLLELQYVVAPHFT